MKRILIIAALMFVTAPLALAQDATDDALIAMEKQAWEAWKNHDGDFFQGFLADEALNITPAGLEDEKAQIVKSIAESGCEVRSYSLDNFKVVKLGDDARLLTYAAEQDATCEGSVLPAKVLSTAVYVKRGDTWMNTLYQETPVN